MNNKPRELEKQAFMKAFHVYMLPFVRKANGREVTLRKDSSGIVFFEFIEGNSVKTIRSFDDDLLFAYNIAVEAIKENAEKENSKFEIQINKESAIVKLK